MPGVQVDGVDVMFALLEKSDRRHRRDSRSGSAARQHDRDPDESTHKRHASTGSNESGVPVRSLAKAAAKVLNQRDYGTP